MSQDVSECLLMPLNVYVTLDVQNQDKFKDRKNQGKLLNRANKYK